MAVFDGGRGAGVYDVCIWEGDSILILLLTELTSRAVDIAECRSVS